MLWQCLMFQVWTAQAGKWEWAGEVDLAPGNYSFTFLTVEGAYADATMMVSFHEHDVEEETIHELWEDGAPVRSDLWQEGVLYEVEFDTSLYATIQQLKIQKEGEYFFYFQHFPEEFGVANERFLRKSTGVDIPVHMHDEEEESSDRIGVVIGATVIVTAVSLVGIIVLMPIGNKLNQTIEDAATAFASGCMLAAANFLMLPEAVHLIGEEAVSESNGNTVYAVSVLAGFILGGIIHWTSALLTPSVATGPVASEAKVEGHPESVALQGEMSVQQTEKQNKRMGSVVWSVLVGDFFHNFVDGVAIGVAFSICDTTTGWVVTLGSASHEISQELSDFLVLTSNGMSPAWALFSNFLSGVSCVIGGVVGVYADLTSMATGGLLAFGGGTYIWIATVECFSKLMGAASWQQVALRLAFWLIGCLVIGLVLLRHEHCAVGGGHHHGHS